MNDEGEYTCTATNEAGSVSASATIKVMSPPVITISPNQYLQVMRGDPVQVICRAEGYPEPEVSIKCKLPRLRPLKLYFYIKAKLLDIEDIKVSSKSVQ